MICFTWLRVFVDTDKLELNVTGHEVVVTVEGEGLLEVVTDCYHPEFGLSIENRKIMFRSDAKLPIEITTRIRW